MKAYLLLASPYDPATDAIVPTRFSAGTLSPVVGGNFWSDRLVSVINVTTDLFQGTTPGGTIPSVGSVKITMDDDQYQAIKGYDWHGRQVEIYEGEHDAAFASYTLIFKGTARNVDWDRNEFSINLRDQGHRLQIPIQQTLYAGTGGIEGGADHKGRPKPLAFGSCVNIGGVLLDNVKQVYQVHERSIQAVVGVYDRSIALVNGGASADIWNVSPAEGSYTYDLSAGLIRLGAKADGPVTFDIQGDNVGGYVSTIPDIVTRILNWKGGFDNTQIDTASITAIKASRNYGGRLYLDEERQLYDILNDLFRSLTGWFTFTALGLFTCGLVTLTTPVVTLQAHEFQSLRAEANEAVVWRRKVGYAPVSQTQAAEFQDRPLARDTENVAGTPAQTVLDLAQEAYDSIAATGGSADQAAASAAEAASEAAAAATSAANAAQAESDAIAAQAAAIIAQGAAEDASADAIAAQAAALVSAGNASNSATAASNSAISAESHYRQGVMLTRNPYFEQDKLGWASTYTGQNVPDTTAAGVTIVAGQGISGGKVLQAVGYQVIYTAAAIPVDTARVYRVTAKAKRTVDHTSGSGTLYFGVVCLDQNYAVVGEVGGHCYVPSYGTNITVAQGWQTFTGTFTGTGSANSGVFRVGTKYVRALALLNYSTGNGTVILDELVFEDVTESTSASTSATAAATSASNASTSATNAASSATSATTSANTASTQASNAASSATAASTSASNASTYATNAGNSASAAATSATNAANSATGASNSASAAATSASSAATQATNAGNSATAAESSRLSAESAYKQTVYVNGNPDMDQGVVGWSHDNDGAVAPDMTAGFVTVVAGVGKNGSNVLQATVYRQIYSQAAFAVDVNRKYRVKARVKRTTAVAGGTTANVYVGVVNLNADYDPISTGSVGQAVNQNSYCAASAQLPNEDVWVEYSGIITGEHDTSSTAFRFGTVNARIFALLNYNTGTSTYYLDELSIEDVTNSEAAAASASAAATSASSASTSATNAATSASSATTSANTASTQASNASTSASAAATSASNAASSSTSAGTSASQAATSATNAANSATAAGNSATAASTSASNASTYATNASTAATAAESSALSAAAQYRNTILLGRNPYMEEGLVGWSQSYDGQQTSDTTSAWVTAVSGVSGHGTVLEANAYRYIYSSRAFPVTTSRKYKVRGVVRRTVNPTVTPANVYIGVTCLDASYILITHKYVAAFATNPLVADGWVTYEGIITGEHSSTNTTFAVGTVHAKLLAFLNYNSGNGTLQLAELSIEDVTESQEASGSASAAATSASNASASATSAGNSATSATTSANTATSQATNASNSATAASTSASNASTSATNASSSASAASTSATSASTHASNASTSATNASTSATNAANSATSAANSATAAGNSATAASTSAANASTSAASAATSSTVAAQINAGGLIKNPIFQDWPTGQTLPTGWLAWSGTTPTRETSLVKGGSNAVRFNAAAGVQTGLYTTGVASGVGVTRVISSNAINYLVLECDFYWESGTLNGAAIGIYYYVHGTDAAAGNVQVNLFTEAGSPTGGGWFSVRKVIPAPFTPVASSAYNLQIYMAANWTAFNATLPAKNIVFQRCVIREATLEERGSGQVGSAISAAVAVETSARVTALGVVESKYAVKVNANGYVSGFGLISTANNAAPTSAFYVDADAFYIAKTGVSSKPFYYDAVAATLYLDNAYIKNLTADKLAVGGNRGNLVINGGFEEGINVGWGNAYAAGSGNYYAQVTTTTPRSGQNYLLFQGTTVVIGTKQFPVTPGKKYVLKASSFASGASSTGLYFRLHYKATPVSSTNGVIRYEDRDALESSLYENGAVATTWVDHAFEVTIPAGMYWASVAIWKWTAISAQTLYIDNVEFFEKAAGTDIQDGVINTNHLIANMVHTKHLYVGSSANGSGVDIDGTTGRITSRFSNGVIASQIGPSGSVLALFNKPDGNRAFEISTSAVTLGDNIVLTGNVQSNAITNVYSAFTAGTMTHTTSYQNAQSITVTQSIASAPVVLNFAMRIAIVYYDDGYWGPGDPGSPTPPTSE